MNVDLSAIRIRLNKLKADCVNPSSDFYKSPDFRPSQIKSIDDAIGRILRNCLPPNRPKAVALKEQWESFKKNLELFIETDKKVRSAEGETEGKTIELFFNELQHKETSIAQSLRAVRAVWDTFKATQPNPGLKEFIGVMVEPLRAKIESMIVAESANTPPASVARQAQTTEELAIAASQINLEQEEAARAAEKRRLLFQDTPNIAKLTQLLALRIEGGEYGEKIREAFLESQTSVISSSSFLKFLLLEASSHSSIPHTFHQWELDISDENWEAINRAKDRIGKNIRPEIIEEVFLTEGSLSEEAQSLSDQLNETVNHIQISREDEQIYGQFLWDILQASCAYQEVLKGVNTSIDNPSEAIHVLSRVVRKFGSLDPQSFFAAIDRIIEAVNIEAVNEDRDLINPEEGIEVWLNNVSEELEKNPHIMTSFRGGNYLWDHLEPEENEPILYKQAAQFSILLVPELFKKEPLRAFELIEKVLKYGNDQPDETTPLTLPIELFQMLLERHPAVALEIATYIPLRDRFQCMIRLIHFTIESLYSGFDLDTLLDLTIDGARGFMERLLFKYLDEPTPKNTQKLKTEIRRLLKYLKAEIGTMLPQKVKDVHPAGSAREQIEYALLEDCLHPSESTPKKEYANRNKVRILFLPELVRIGKRDKALEFAKEDLDWIIYPSTNTENLPIKELAYSLLKASGFKSPWLDSHTLGPLSEPENLESLLLDLDFIALYLKAMKSAQDLKWVVQELISLSAAAHEISIRHSNPSYEAFALEAANLALEKIKGIKTIKRIPIEQRIKNFLAALEFIGYWTQSLGFLDAQEAQNIQREFEGKLFDLRKEYLATLTEPGAQVLCCIDLFRESVFVGKEDEGLSLARQVLRLNPAFSLDPRTGDMGGAFIDLLYVAKRNIEIMSLRQGEEARRLESEMKRFTLDLIGSLDNLYASSELFIQVAKALEPPSIEFFAQAGARVLELIQTLKATGAIDLVVQKSVLIEVIRRFGDRAPEVTAQAKILLGDALQELFDRRYVSYVNPVEKLAFLKSLVEGFELLENSDQVISLTTEALALITPQNFLAQTASLAQLVEGLAVYVKRVHDKRSTDLALEPDKLELSLIELALSGLLCVHPPNDRVVFLLRVPRGLTGYGYLTDSALYKEFSRRALNLALEEIRALQTDQEGLMAQLIESANPVDSVLADQCRRELSHIQARSRRDDEGPPNKRSNI